MLLIIVRIAVLVNIVSIEDGWGGRMLIDDVVMVGMFLEVGYWMWTDVMSLKETGIVFVIIKVMLNDNFTVCSKNYKSVRVWD